MLRTIVRRFGRAAEVVETEEYVPPAPTAGQVRVGMLLASVNPSDLVPIAGAYASRTSLPMVPGFEGVGVVEQVGAGVVGLAPGRRVLPLGSAGAWQQVKTTDAAWCVPVPDWLTDEQAACAYINPLTAHRMVQAHVPPGEGTTVVVDAAASAIGLMLVRMLNQAGNRVVALVRHPRGREQLASVVPELEQEAVLCTADAGWRTRLRERTGPRGHDVVLDAVGGSLGAELAALLAPQGTLVHYGLLSGEPLPADLRTRRPDVNLILFRLRDWVHAVDREQLGLAMHGAFRLVADGVAATAVAAVHDLPDVRRALEADAARGRAGKILLSLR